MNQSSSSDSPIHAEDRSGFRTLLLLAVAAVAAFGLIYWSQRTPAGTAGLEKTDRLSESEQDALLEKKEELTTNQLIALAAGLKVSANAPLPVQMKWINDKKEISKLLLGKTNDEIAQKEGVLYRLEALQRYAYINRKYGLGDATVDAELNELSLANLDHGHPEIAKIAAVTLMLTDLQKFVNQPNPETRRESLQTCRDTVARLPDDEEVAAALFVYARVMKSTPRVVSDSIEFFQLVVDAYLGSENAVASRLAKESYFEIIFGDQTADKRSANLLIVGIQNRFREQDPAVEQEVSRRIRYALNDELLDQQAVEQIFRLLELLLSNGKIESAAQLKDELVAYFSTATDPELASTSLAWLGGLETRLRWFEEPLDFAEFAMIGSGQPFQRDTRGGIFVFWSPEDQPLMRMVSALSGEPSLRDLQLVAVCDQPEPGDREFLEKFAAEMEDLSFVTFSGGNDRFPIPRLPYLLLVDARNNLIAANPDFQDLGMYARRLAE